VDGGAQGSGILVISLSVPVETMPSIACLTTADHLLASGSVVEAKTVLSSESLSLMWVGHFVASLSAGLSITAGCIGFMQVANVSRLSGRLSPRFAAFGAPEAAPGSVMLDGCGRCRA